MNSVVSYILIFLCLINFVLGMYILFSRFHSKYSTSFFVLCLGISTWVIANFLFQQEDRLNVAYYYNQLANVGALTLVSGLYFFSKNYPQTSFEQKKYNFWDLANLSAVLIFIFLCFIPNLVDKDVFLNSKGVKSVEPGTLKYAYFIIILFNLISIFLHLTISYRKHTGIFKEQIKYFLILFIGSAVGGVLLNLILPALKLYDYVTFGPAFTILQTVGSVYCMLNYRYADFRLIFSYLVEKLILIFVLIGGLFVYLRTANSLSPDGIGIFLFLYSLYLILVIYSYDSYKNKLQNRYLFAPNFNYHIQAFDRKALMAESESKLIKELNSTLQKILQISSCQVVLRNNDEEKRSIKLLDSLYDKSSKKIYLYDEERKKYYDQLISNQFVLKALNKLREITNFENVIQLKYLNNNLGYLLFSPKKYNRAFSKYEIIFLKNLIDNFSTYLYKIELYEQKENLNNVLEQKVKEATSKLRKQKRQLQEKYQFEKDMMGIMGHELRTPMTVAKGMAEQVMSKAIAGHVDPPYVADKMEKVYNSIIKEADLIQTMLSSSHLDNDRLNLQISLVDLREAVQYSVTAFKKDAERKNLKFTYVEPKFEMPLIMLDPSRCQEIVNNLVSNAVKYTKEGHVKIYFTKTKDSVLLSIEDTGSGIPKDEIKNLGQKFHRINQHLDKEKQIVRSGGTGLGLYVVKGLLEAFGGELLVESEVGKGSTFTAVFPIISKYHNAMHVQMQSGDEAHDMFENVGLKK